MRSYPLYIDGQDRDGQGWNYTVKASALLADPMGTFNLKRALDLGQMDPSEAPADVVVGRSAWGERRECAEALEAAKRASREFARMPLEDRRAMTTDYHNAIVERAEEFVEILVWEGHPRRLAQWEVRGIIEGTSPETAEFQFAQLRSEIEQGERRIVGKREIFICEDPWRNVAIHFVSGNMHKPGHGDFTCHLKQNERARDVGLNYRSWLVDASVYM